MGILFETVSGVLNKEKMKQMRIDIRMGMTSERIAKKYKISQCSARNYIRNYKKALEFQKNKYW